MVKSPQQSHPRTILVPRRSTEAVLNEVETRLNSCFAGITTAPLLTAIPTITATKIMIRKVEQRWLAIHSKHLINFALRKVRRVPMEQQVLVPLAEAMLAGVQLMFRP